MKVIEKYKKNKIFIFPQTVHYKSQSRLLSDAKAFSKNKNVTICARDKKSFELLSNNFKNEILLVPDMAFASTYKVNNNIPKSSKNLFLLRKDREVSNTIYVESLQSFNICDWPTFNHNVYNIAQIFCEKINRWISKPYYNKIVKGKMGDTTFGLLKVRDCTKMIKEGVDYISEYNLVVTTRLHGHILSLLLGIPSIMIDNNYGKNSSFYETWLEHIHISKCVKNHKELDNEIKNNIK